MLAHSVLADPATLPLYNAETLIHFGSTLVVAPHPDDESLGCGGIIASLRTLGLAVHVLVVSDGTMSHPNSRRYPPAALRTLREQETRTALTRLGVDLHNVYFLGLKDSAVPIRETSDFNIAEALCTAYFNAIHPDTILLPWRRDPHCDHRATFKLVQAAVVDLPYRPRLVEYPIWVWELAAAGDAPEVTEVHAWRVDISAVLAQKQKAIAAHLSQTTNLIDDDPSGFRLTSGMLAHFAHPWEVYLEERA